MSYLVSFILLFNFNLLQAQTLTIPEFTPNVVDLTGTLTTVDTQDINATIQTIRTSSDMLAAVLLVSSLQGESIESYSERVFQSWKIGERGKDNGLLLVLAISDRNARFEVGYGLEGDLPDIVARHALDDVLGPRMREGEVKRAIIDSLTYMAAIKSKSQVFTPTAEVSSTESDSEGFFSTTGVKLGGFSFLIYLVCLWLMPPIANAWARRRATHLEAKSSLYKLDDDPRFNKKTDGSIFFRVFLSINPGAFIYLFASMNLFVAAGIAAFILLIVVMYTRAIVKPYQSIEAYQLHLMLEKTRAEYARRSKGSGRSSGGGSSSSSSSSSRSSSSSSSSSGGGRSGGGGSSSRW